MPEQSSGASGGSAGPGHCPVKHGAADIWLYHHDTSRVQARGPSWPPGPAPRGCWSGAVWRGPAQSNSSSNNNNNTTTRSAVSTTTTTTGPPPPPRPPPRLMSRCVRLLTPSPSSPSPTATTAKCSESAGTSSVCRYCRYLSCTGVFQKIYYPRLIFIINRERAELSNN